MELLKNLALLRSGIFRLTSLAKVRVGKKSASKSVAATRGASERRFRGEARSILADLSWRELDQRFFSCFVSTPYLINQSARFCATRH
jgi:hypothetical protein